MIRLTLTAALASFAIAAEAAPGYLNTTLEVAHRTAPLDVHIWFPAESGTPLKLGKNAIFKGSDVLRDATPQSGAFPIAVLSHGSGGNAANLSWLAGALAEQGMIVLAANHPGTTSGDSQQSDTIRVWERPQDQSALVDFAANLPLGLTADMRSITSIGFSLGGYTALAHAGARVRKAGYTQYCDNNPQMQDCQWFKAGGVSLHDIEPTHFEQSNHDPRITQVVGIDPAIAQGYTDDSLAAMNLPALLINMGDTPLGIDASIIAPRIPGAQFATIKGATHFSFLGICKTMGKAILFAVGEDPICSEVTKRKRASIHQELKTLIGDFIFQETKTAPKS